MSAPAGPLRSSPPVEERPAGKGVKGKGLRGKVNCTASGQFVRVGNHHWYVEQSGSGPEVLLIHGTGASSHSWRGLMPLLAPHFRLLAVDLPGHGLTTSPTALRLTLPAMSEAVDGLLAHLECRPRLAVGHSAGAAILARMCLDQRIDPAAVVSINGALLPLRGMPGLLFSPAARLLASSGIPSRLFAWQAARTDLAERLIDGTGSKLPDDALSDYRRLLQNPSHVAGALNMMANWRLDLLARDLPRLSTPLLLIAAQGDTTVPPQQADRVQAICPQAQVVRLPSLGHLAHEERPRTAAALLLRAARNAGVGGGSRLSAVT